MPPYLTGALSTIGSSAGGLLSLVGRLSGLMPILGLLSGRFGSLSRIMNSYASVVGSLVGTVSKATGELRTMGNAITDLRAATGMSAGGSGALINAWGAQGLSAGQASSAFGSMNPYEAQARARMFGASSFSDVAGLARGYQATSPLMRNQMLGSADSPELRRILMQSPGAIQANQGFQNRVQSGLGIDPGTIEQVSQQLSSVTTRFRVLGSGVLLKLASEVLPRFINILDVVSIRIGERANAIGAAIETGVSRGFEALLSVGELISRIPEMMFALGDAVLSFASVAITLIPQVWEIFLDGISIIQNGLGVLAEIAGTGFQNLMGIGDMLGNSFLSLVDTMQYVSENIQGPFQAIQDGITGFLNAIYESPIVQQLLSGAGLGGAPGRDSAPQRMMRAGPILGPIGDFLAPVQTVVENALRGVGVPEALAATGGILLPTAAAGYALRGAGAYALGALGIGGAAGAGAAGAGAAGAGATGAGAAGAGAAGGGTTISSLLFNPITATVAGGLALGTAAGYGWFKGTQRHLGMNQGKGFFETMGHGVGVINDFFTGNNGRTQANYDRALRERAARANNSPADAAITGAANINSAFGDFFSGMRHARRGSWSAGLVNGIHGAPGALGNMARGAWNNFSNTPHSSWATALDNRVGGGAGLQSQASAMLEAARRELEKAKGAYDGDEVRKLLRESLGEQKKQTNLLQGESQRSRQSADAVAGIAIFRFGQESGQAIRRAGNS